MRSGLAQQVWVEAMNHGSADFPGADGDEDPSLDRSRAVCERVERELKKSPDFQLYLITRSRSDRARMERVLVQDPNFRLWRALTACDAAG